MSHKAELIPNAFNRESQIWEIERTNSYSIIYDTEPYAWFKFFFESQREIMNNYSEIFQTLIKY